MAVLFICSRQTLAAITASNDPSDPCSTHALNAYQACVQDNGCTDACGDPNDENWTIYALEPKRCRDMSNIFCEHVNCCGEACVAELSFYHNCLAREIAEIYFGVDNNCLLFICPDTSYGNSQRKLADGSQACEAEVSELRSCVKEAAECSHCDLYGLDALGFVAATKTCEEMHHGLFCPWDSCCPSCHSELDAVASCVKTNLLSDHESCPDQYCPVQRMSKRTSPLV